MVEELGSIPLQLLVALVAHNGRSSTGQAFLGDVHVVPFHPLWPVASVAAVNKTGTFQEQGCPGHDRGFLGRVVQAKSKVGLINNNLKFILKEPNPETFGNVPVCKTDDVTESSKH